MKKFQQEYPDWKVYWETLAAIGAATGSSELLDYAMEHQGGTITMCTALQNLKQEGIQQGEIRGTIRTLRGICVQLTKPEIYVKLRS